jgi:glycosyltransferase involved in cell wall biosynthesis
MRRIGISRDSSIVSIFGVQIIKISVVTAARNAADTIARTLESVRSQTLPDVEHIVIDGASTDDTARVVRANAQRVNVFVSEPDSGVYDAFNKGLMNCSGDVVGFLNAGDVYIGPGVLARIAEELELHGVDAVFADVAIVDAVDNKRVVRRYSSARFAPGRIRGGFMPAHPTLFIRRDVYRRFGFYDASYRIAGDFELVARLFGRYQISFAYIPEVLIEMPHGGLSNNGLRSVRVITSEMRRACAENGIKTSTARLLMRIPLKLTELRFSRSK